MPVTAKLSRKFYERLGDDIAGELVDWFNAVDTAYQSQLRETNELNWERFKAELHGQGAELRGEIHVQGAQLRAEINAQGTALRAEIHAQGAELRAEIHAQGAAMCAQNAELRREIGADISALETRMMKWMFIYWSGTMLPLAALLLATLRR